MMISWHVKAFCIIGLMCRKPTGHHWISPKKDKWWGSLILFVIGLHRCWINNRVAVTWHALMPWRRHRNEALCVFIVTEPMIAKLSMLDLFFFTLHRLISHDQHTRIYKRDINFQRYSGYSDEIKSMQIVHTGMTFGLKNNFDHTLVACHVLMLRALPTNTNDWPVVWH